MVRIHQGAFQSGAAGPDTPGRVALHKANQHPAAPRGSDAGEGADP